MTAPTPGPSLADLDKAVIDAGRAYADVQRATPRDEDLIAANRTSLESARTARGYANV